MACFLGNLEDFLLHALLYYIVHSRLFLIFFTFIRFRVFISLLLLPIVVDILQRLWPALGVCKL